MIKMYRGEGSEGLDLIYIKDGYIYSVYVKSDELDALEIAINAGFLSNSKVIIDNPLGRVDY